MRYIPTELEGAYIIELEPKTDHRGFFARGFDQKEFEEHGLKGAFVQANISWNAAKATLRGMHYQMAPYAEVKVIRCTRGSIYDVIIDLRPDSPTFCKWIGVELTAQNYRTLYVPEGFAHGYQTLEPDTETFYLVTEFYAPTHERGVRWNDPAFGIQWALPNPILSERDQNHPWFQR